jgi:hypothetical protein
MIHKFLVQIDDAGQTTGIPPETPLTIIMMLMDHFHLHSLWPGAEKFTATVVQEEREPDICPPNPTPEHFRRSKVSA